jgi:hypothetical protein
MHPHKTHAQVVLYKVVPIGNSREDITLQLLGFYEVVKPYLLSFSPKDKAAQERGQPGRTWCTPIHKHTDTHRHTHTNTSM